MHIVKQGGTFYAVFTIEQPARKKTRPDQPSAAYIDPNSKNIGYGLGTDGQAFEIQNIQGLRGLDARLDKLKRKRDRCKKKSRKVTFVRDDGSVHVHWQPSRAWARRDRAVKKLDYRRQEQIKQVLYSISHRMFDRYDVVGIGDWSPSNGDSGLGKKANRTLRSRRHHGELRRVLHWVAEKRGTFAYVMDETGTTRTCHACGHVVADGLHPSVRAWDCEGCGTRHIRDENAAQNGLERLLAVSGLHQVPSSGRSAVTSRSRWSCLPGGRWVERDWTVPQDHAIKPIRTGQGSGADHPSRIDPTSDLHAAA